MLSVATLFATWFGAGTLMTMTDEVAETGLRAALLDPIGAGFCLIIVGFFYAVPLWQQKLITLADFFKQRFGVTTEKWAAVVMLPTYFGWIAIQYIALAELLFIFTGLPQAYGLSVVAIIGTSYALIGGMWSVTLTDLVQSIALVLGLILLVCGVFNELGSGDMIAGLKELFTRVPSSKLTVFPHGTMKDVFHSINLVIIGSLGNVAGQDLAQRVFAAKSAKVARRACVIAGVLYILLGFLPMLIGLASSLVLSSTQSVVLNLIAHIPSQVLVCIFVVMILSVVLSTIDSAILSPATVLSQNLLKGRVKLSDLALNRLCVFLIGALSLIVAYVGEGAYALLEQAYEMQLVGLFIPLTVGLFMPRVSEKSIIMNMAFTIGVWLLHKACGWEYFMEPFLATFHLPVSTTLVLISLTLCFQWGHPTGTKL